MKTMMSGLLENMPGKTAGGEGCKTCSLKLVKYVALFFCIVLLPLSQHFSTTDNNIAPAPPKNPSHKNNDKGFLYAKGNDLDRDLTLEYLNSQPQQPIMNRVKRNPRRTILTHENSTTGTRLTNLLIMYPCCATIIIILGMEIFGQGLRDPLNKFTNLVLIFLCVILSLVMFSVSLMTALRTLETTMIIISALSFLFFVLELADFILLLSQ